MIHYLLINKIYGATKVEIYKIYFRIFLEQLTAFTEYVRVRATDLYTKHVITFLITNKGTCKSRSSTCTPKRSSDSCLRTNAHSCWPPPTSDSAMAISPQVISAPSFLHNLRKGRFPTVVRGARYNFPRQSIYE